MITVSYSAKFWPGLQPEALGQIACVRSSDHLPFAKPQHRAVGVRRVAHRATLADVRRVGGHPLIGDLVAREEPAQVRA